VTLGTADTELPLYESICEVVNCPERGKVFEWYASRSDAPERPCSYCAQPTVRQFSRFNSPFCGAITARYLDRGLEGGNAPDGGHWAWKKKTLSGKPEPVYIESFQDQKTFCREEGLALPSDSGPGFISADGKSITSATKKEAAEYISHANHETTALAAKNP
jgi:hypothetical protein